jgi:mannose-1-phosphate guanylyltransferase/phosphomannomutase
MRKEMKAIILAGGKGTRLKPFTEALPKPMLPLGPKPLLETLIRYLKQYGFDEVVLAIHYLGDNITNYFEDGKRFGIKIIYSKEEALLGTAGAVKKAAKGIDDTFVTILGDGLADIDYNDLVAYHKNMGAIGTMVVTEKKISIPYGVLYMNTDKDNVLLNVKEKPELAFNVNTGIVVLEPKCLDYMKDGESLGMTDFFQRLKDAGEKVVAYHHKGTWVDIGQDIGQYLNVNQEIIRKNITFNQILTNIIFGDVKE